MTAVLDIHDPFAGLLGTRRGPALRPPAKRRAPSAHRPVSSTASGLSDHEVALKNALMREERLRKHLLACRHRVDTVRRQQQAPANTPQLGAAQDALTRAHMDYEKARKEAALIKSRLSTP